MGIFVFLKGPKCPVNRAFALMCIGFLDWQICAFLMYYLQSDIQQNYLARIGYTLILFLPFIAYHFTVSFLNIKEERKWVWRFYFIGFIWLILLWATNLFIVGSIKYRWGYYAKAGSLHPLYLVFAAFAFGRTLFLLGTSLLDKNRPAIMRNQSRFIFMAIIVFYTAAIEYLINYGYDIYPIGSFLIFAAFIIIAFAIVRYQLMDITFVMKMGLSFTSVLLMVFIPFYVFTLLMQKNFYGYVNRTFALALFLLFLLSAVFLYRLKAIVEQTVEKTFFRAKYDAYKILKKFTAEIITVTDFKELLNSIIKTFVATLKIDKASIFLFDEETRRFKINASNGLGEELVKKISYKENDFFISWLKEKGKIVITEELERFTADDEDIKKAWDTLRLMESELCMPFIYKGEMIGFLNLGAKGDRSMYNHEDIELFLSLGHQTAIAIKNALLIERIKESKLIIRRMERLKTIGDMAAGLAHEIRNPLVPIKTCLELLPERYGKDKEFTERIPRNALQEVERIEGLLKEIMDYSRPRMPVFKEIDINDIVEKTAAFIEYEAKKKGIKIESEFDAALPLIKADSEQIKQVLLNLIINAIDAVNGNGRISIKTNRATHAVSPCGKVGKSEYVQIEIADNGAGIPQENLDRIFNPFYTTKHQSKEREGTGLGLAIVQEILTEHCGFVQVRSEFGKGSTFLVNLPIDCSEFAKIADRINLTSQI